MHRSVSDGETLDQLVFRIRVDVVLSAFPFLNMRRGQIPAKGFPINLHIQPNQRIAHFGQWSCAFNIKKTGQALHHVFLFSQLVL